MNFHFTHKNLTFITAANLNECSHEYSLSRSQVAQKQGAAQKRRVAPNRFARRRGQALLISVLLMVFAAVLGATFVTVVALNLSQTARSGSVASAKQAALAGKTFVNEQLTNSEKGERWLPIDAQSGVTAGDTYYFSDFERAQGWDQQGYVKFPDPRSTTASANGAPIYLTKVTPVVAPLVSDPEHDFDGQLRVNIIGRASDNDAVSSRLVFYKPTTQNGNFTKITRYVSNWNFAKNRVRTGDDNDRTPIGTKLTSLIGTNLTLDGEGDGTDDGTAIPAQSADGSWLIQSGLELTNKDQFGFTNALDTVKVLRGVTIKPGAAATLSDGGPVENIAPSTTPVASRSTLQKRIVDGESYNNDPSSGQTVRTITPSRLDGPDSRWLRLTKYSDNANGSQYGWGDKNGVYIDNSTDRESIGQLVDDGTPLRRRAYRPMSDFEDQRFWTRKSFPLQSNLPVTTLELGTTNLPGNSSTTLPFTSDAYPFVNNTAHRLTYSRRGVSDSQAFPLGDTLINANDPADLNDDAIYRPSLEQRAIRGWVSRDEFIPRGAFVELKGDKIVITRDDLADVSSTWTTPNLPNPEKTWKDANGNSIPSAYRMEIRNINIPTSTRVVGADGDTAGVYTAPGSGFNGVIYAEGNIRVRGYTNDKNITIVSMNNIYIEGGINKLGSGNVALLAKRNVVVNPTQVVARVEGSRNIFAMGDFNAGALNTGDTSTSLTHSGNSFPLRIGDKFRFNASSVWRTVYSVTAPVYNAVGNTTSASVGFNPAIGAGETIGAGNLTFLAISTSSLGEGSPDIIARDVKLDGANPSGSYWFALRHSGADKMALNFNRQNGTSGNGSVEVTSNNTPTKTLTLTPSTPATYDLRTIAAPPLPGNAAANTLGALVWQFYRDDGSNGTIANSGDREVVNIDPDGAGPLPAVPAYGESDVNTDWDLFIPTANLGILARRLANVPAASPAIIPPLPGLTLAQGGDGSVPLTVSVGLYNTNSALSFGSTPISNIGSSFNGTEFEYPNTIEKAFYKNALYSARTTVNFGSALSATDSNIAAFRRLLTPEGDLLPAYYQREMKLDRETLADVASIDPIKVNIEATIYAQNGSWFVIPMPYLDNVATAPSADVQKSRRYNYQFTVQGNIAENYVPTSDIDTNPDGTPNPEVDADNKAEGAQARWIDALSRPTALTGGLGTDWQSIKYERDTSPYKPISADNLLYLPITPDITYQR